MIVHIIWSLGPSILQKKEYKRRKSGNLSKRNDESTKIPRRYINLEIKDFHIQ